MDILKKVFPLSFKVAPKDVKGLIINLVIYLVVGFVMGLVVGLLAKIPVLGLVFGFVGGFIGLYCTVGGVLSILKFLDVLK